MPLISDEDRQFLIEYFGKELQDSVKITFFTQRQSPLVVPSHVCAYCKETKELLEEVAGLSDKIELTVYDLLADESAAKEHGIEKIPAVVITGKNKGRIRYFGIPAGYEFASLVEVIADVSKGKPSLEDATKKELAKVDRDLHIQVFVTPT